VCDVLLTILNTIGIMVKDKRQKTKIKRQNEEENRIPPSLRSREGPGVSSWGREGKIEL
jgi:hypothetical protein